MAMRTQRAMSCLAARVRGYAACSIVPALPERRGAGQSGNTTAPFTNTCLNTYFALALRTGQLGVGMLYMLSPGRVSRNSNGKFNTLRALPSLTGEVRRYPVRTFSHLIERRRETRRLGVLDVQTGLIPRESFLLPGLTTKRRHAR